MPQLFKVLPNIVKILLVAIRKQLSQEPPTLVDRLGVINYFCKRRNSLLILELRGIHLMYAVKDDYVSYPSRVHFFDLE